MNKHWILTLALLGAGMAQAEVLKDPQWQVWEDEGKSQELERAARQRLQAQPQDVQGILGLGIANLMDGSNEKSRAAAIEAAQGCVERAPKEAACHYVLGSLQGIEAQQGMFKAMRLAGSIKEHLLKAVELDPLLYEAREALTQFYLMAPSAIGGSVDKARELAVQAQARQPEHAKLLRALIATQQEQFAEAERELRGVKAGEDKDLRDGLRQGLSGLAQQRLRAKDYAGSKALFESIAKDFPEHAVGFYGQGRNLSALNQPEEAIRLFERARTLKGARHLPIDHRLGQALLAKGDKAQARVALERFVRDPNANPVNLKEARKLLEDLG